MTLPAALTTGRWRLFVALVVIALAQTGASILAAGALSRLFAELMSPRAIDTAQLRTLLATTVAIAVLELGKRRTTEALGLDHARDVRERLFERLLRRPVPLGPGRSHASTLLPFLGDLTALRQWYADGLARGAAALLIMLSVLGFVAARNALLGATLAGLNLCAILVLLALVAPLARATAVQRNLRGALASLVADRIAAAHTVLACGGVRREMKRIGLRIDRLNAASMRRATLSGIVRATCGAAVSLCTLGTLLIAHREVVAGTLAPHDIVGLLSLVGLIGVSLHDLGRVAELAVPGRIAVRRIRARLAEIEPLGDTGTQPGMPSHADLLLRDLELPGVANRFTARAQDGDIVLVQGAPGCGKSLLLALIAGLRRPQHGEVSLRQRQTFGLSARRRRRDIGYAGGHAPLLGGSLRMNLRYRLRGTPDGALAALLTEFGLVRLLTPRGAIRSLRVTAQGGCLSAADRQALQLIRALAGSPRLLLLDDVDNQLSDAQQRALATHLRRWRGIVILVSQSAALRRIANRHWHITAKGVEERVVDAAPLPASAPGAQVLRWPLDPPG